MPWCEALSNNEDVRVDFSLCPSSGRQRQRQSAWCEQRAAVGATPIDVRERGEPPLTAIRQSPCSPFTWANLRRARLLNLSFQSAPVRWYSITHPFPEARPRKNLVKEQSPCCYSRSPWLFCFCAPHSVISVTGVALCMYRGMPNDSVEKMGKFRTTEVNKLELLYKSLIFLHLQWNILLLSLLLIWRMRFVKHGYALH